MALASGYEGPFVFGDRPLINLMKGEQDLLMANPHGAVDQFFDDYGLCVDPVVYLVEPPVVLDRVIMLQGPFVLDAEDGSEINVVKRTMQIFGVFRRHTEAPVLDREIGNEEPVGIRYASQP